MAENIACGDNTSSSLIKQEERSYCSNSGTLPETVLAELDNYFKDRFSEHNPDIIKFRQGLDREAMKMMPLISDSFSVNAEQIIVYNWLIANDPMQKRNRKQAILQLLWLVPILTRLRFMPFHPDRLCEPILSFDRWQLERQTITDTIDAGTSLFDCVASLLKMPREIIAKCRCHVIPEFEWIKRDQVDLLLRVLSWISPAVRPKSENDWICLETQLTCYIKLIAASHRIPTFLVLSDRRMARVGAGLCDSAFEDILIGWFRRDSQLQERCQGGKRSHLIASLNHADTFLVALSEALDVNLGAICRSRPHTLSMHTAIICAWLESATIAQIANLSARWHELLRKNQNSKFDNPLIIYDDIQNERLDHGTELAWTLIQSHKLGAKFRRTYVEHIDVMEQS
jgi:hypothetical protein